MSINNGYKKLDVLTPIIDKNPHRAEARWGFLILDEREDHLF